MLPIRACTRSPEATASLAANLAELSTTGDLILLCGDLGAGKTAFAKGFGAALGVDEPITSPTFTLVREYQGRLKMYHLDVYRLHQVEDTLELGLSELLDDDAVTLIEWGESILAALPPEYLEIRIQLEYDDDERTFELHPVGRRWGARRRLLEQALEQWLIQVGPADNGPADNGPADTGPADKAADNGPADNAPNGT